MIKPKFADYISTEIFRTLVAVADTRSLRAAADRLRISTSAAIMHVERVKKIVGVDLFQQQSGSLVPTETGEQVLCIARDILTLYDRLFQLKENHHEASSNRNVAGASTN